MHPFLALFAGFSTTATTPTTFWQDASKVKNLADPPSSKFLKNIQDEPWRGGLEPIPVTGIPEYEAVVIEGKIPYDLQGILCRNGPGRIRIGDSQYGHWFDGDGVISKLTIDGPNQKAFFMAKYVETDRFRLQQKIDQTSGNVPFATAGAWTKKGRGGFLENVFAIPTNPSNTNVIFLDGEQKNSKPRLFALAEGGNPVEMDPISLETRDCIALESATGEKTQSFFSAHYKKDPISGHVYNHGLVLGPKSCLNVMKLSSTGELLKQSTQELVPSAVVFIHDNMLSENHFILLAQPYIAPSSSVITSVTGGDPLGQQFRWNPKELNDQTLAFVFSKDTMECLAQVPLPAFSTYHQIDAFEDPSNPNLLFFRALVHDPPNSREQLEEGFKDMYTKSRIPLCQIMQYTLDIRNQRFVDSIRVAPTANLCELPDMNADWKSYRKRFMWANVRTKDAGYVNSLQKVDLDTGECSDIIDFGETTFAGNPIFVPKPDPQREDDGYILCQLYRSAKHRSDVVILDAATMKEVALLRLDSHVTYQFHGDWYPSLL